MPVLIPLLAITLGLLVVAPRSPIAQSDRPSREALLLEQLQIDEIVEDPEGRGITVRGSVLQPDSKIVTGRLIACKRDSDRAWLIIQDHAAQTDDRIAVEPSFCDAFREVVRQRQNPAKR